VQGIIDLYRLSVVHRDLKLANVLLNFPNNKNLLRYTKEEKIEFLKNVNLMEVEFEVKIADFGFAKQTKDASA
jgi:serine/threonine protein kinase